MNRLNRNEKTGCWNEASKDHGPLVPAQNQKAYGVEDVRCPGNKQLGAF